MAVFQRATCQRTTFQRVNSQCAATLCSVIGASLIFCANTTNAEDNFHKLLADGEAYGKLNLRYESAEQDNPLEDADALTLRTMLGYNSANMNGFSATIEFEDVRQVFGLGDYSVGPAGYNVGEYSVIADPEVTEVNQAFIKYSNNGLTAKMGRQIIALDNHRFVGHVGWRQDWQTFDGLTAVYSPNDSIKLTYGYLDKRNRIFAEAADIDSEDHILNGSFKTPIGTIKGYAYLLENEDNNSELDTVGVSLNGKVKADNVSFLYAAEYATQETDTDFEADYLFLEGGVSVYGITAKLGYELLGSDDGAYGFSTPLATLHKFNGWADLFLNTPGTGLVDTHVNIGSKLGPGKLNVIYHTFEADEDSAGMSDYGTEWNLQYVMKFGKHYDVGFKYASYSADDFGVDTDRLWAWVGMSF
ncbi:alginate export family protein [Marinibactrum halimedae]|uniref:Alginate export domain-containing protein n=1 Tax=Marinibactrum halimedae TaxID=1444977 RepID=A0AA37T5Y0_9GAMM|nr:alginate export family protein [Marinibactrum halimedae]MCD9457941.1 alginate export family protein [Marinibactrum halimedae]GLS26229.1 hypothetical protein GCM10007877_19440 [Marinibactrum halimedae]